MEIILNAVNNLGFLLFAVAIQVVRIDILHSIEVMLKYLLFYSRCFAFHSPFPFQINLNRPPKLTLIEFTICYQQY